MTEPATAPGEEAEPDGDAGAGAATDLAPPEPATVVAIVAGFAATLLLVLALLLPAPFVVLKPGPVLNTLGSARGKELISIQGHASYPTSGQLDLTTVSSLGGPGRRVSLAEVAIDWLRRDSTVVPQNVYYPPGQTQQQSKQIDQAEMTDSQESASVAALKALGYTVPADLAVYSVDPKAPAHAVLKSGDVIERVNGRRMSGLDALRAALAKVRDGQPVRLQVLRGGQQVDLSTTTTTDGGRRVLGVSIDERFRLPFTIKIQIDNIGGPSAGEAFALGVIDKLTPGDLTGGKHFAGTGTIDSDGNVGAIGGIRQKMIGARRAGAQYFLAPADNCSEVVGHVPAGLHVLKTSTLSQSRTDIARIVAGKLDAVPTC